MATNNAIKSAARARQAETGESYTEARAAVVAEYDEPIEIEVWVPEIRIGGAGDFSLDTPEARQAWRKLDKNDCHAVQEFAREYLGNDLLTLAADELDPGTASGSAWEAIALAETQSDRIDTYMASDAEWVSRETGQTVTPEQVEYLIDRYGIPDSEQFSDGPDLNMVIKVVPSLPEELATTALLARYADVLAAVDLTAILPDELKEWEHHYPSRRLLMRAIGRGFVSDGTPLDQPGLVWPVEVHKVRAIMECAVEAGDATTLHQCVDVLTAWTHKLADHAASGPDHLQRFADGSWG